MYSVYALLDPTTGEPRYIGSCADFKRRLSTHFARVAAAAETGCSRHHRWRLYEYLAKGLLAGKTIQARVLATHPTKAEALADESQRIRETPGLFNRPQSDVTKLPVRLEFTDGAAELVLLPA